MSFKNLRNPTSSVGALPADHKVDPSSEILESRMKKDGRDMLDAMQDLRVPDTGGCLPDPAVDNGNKPFRIKRG